MMKKIFTLSLLATMATGLQAADYDYLVFTLADGTTRNITATGLTMTARDGNLTATAAGTTVTIPLASLVKMEFSNNADTGIATLTADAVAADAEVYDLNGRRMPQLSGLPKGVYVIKSNGTTKKVTIK